MKIPMLVLVPFIWGPSPSLHGKDYFLGDPERVREYPRPSQEQLLAARKDAWDKRWNAATQIVAKTPPKAAVPMPYLSLTDQIRALYVRTTPAPLETNMVWRGLGRCLIYIHEGTVVTHRGQRAFVRVFEQDLDGVLSSIEADKDFMWHHRELAARTWRPNLDLYEGTRIKFRRSMVLEISASMERLAELEVEKGGYPILDVGKCDPLRLRAVAEQAGVENQRRMEMK